MSVKQAGGLVEWMRRHGISPPPEVELGTVEQPVTIIRDDSGIVRPFTGAIGHIHHSIVAIVGQLHGIELIPTSPGGAWIIGLGTGASSDVFCRLAWRQADYLVNNRGAITPEWVPGRSYRGDEPANVDLIFEGSRANQGTGYIINQDHWAAPLARPLFVPPGWHFIMHEIVAGSDIALSLMWQQIP